MKVTPAKKKFGKHEIGAVFDLPDRPAKALIKLGRLTAADPGLGYQTRMMTAEPAPVQYMRSEPVEAAPYGYKADGTPRARPGRPAKVES